MLRFTHVDWVPKKVDTKLIAPEKDLNLEKYKAASEGPQPGEVLLPQDAQQEDAKEPEFN